ncbi:FAD-binding domain-containing protein [Mycena crocata]|nr:FAD-binding domain-containing protein [Mycena crocata]
MHLPSGPIRRKDFSRGGVTPLLDLKTHIVFQYVAPKMRPSFTSLIFLVFALSSSEARPGKRETCRNVPGSAGYPDKAAWGALNTTVGGRLVDVVPSAKYCASLPGGACTDGQWGSSVFRNTIPGAMNQVNWEQGYDLKPPSLCLRNNATTLCGQGDVPNYSVEAETAEDVQAAVKFVSDNSLRVAIKSSGHDYLGRSTAPDSLLIHTAKLQNVSFTDAFFVGSQNMGPAATAGPGVTLQTLYNATKAQGKIMLGGTAATVCAGGGYLQGAGHSALSPLFGLAADHALEFQVVIANGELIQVNNVTNPDLFWAMRGGGGGSWGVIVAATFSVFPTFNVTHSTIQLVAANNTAAGALAAVHAEHIFDLDSVRGGQYFWLNKISQTSSLSIDSYLNTTTAEGTALLAPFLSAALAIPGVSVVEEEYIDININDALYAEDDSVGINAVLGSRLIPAASYRDAPATVGTVYKRLLDSGATAILGHLVAGGQVADNAGVSSAVNPAWRTAKAHVILVNGWPDSTPLAGIDIVRKQFQTTQLPLLEQISGPDAGSYSSEGDVLEPNFQTTFFGPNYERLSTIKSFYDPADLFIVAAGVGSERWDQWGLCTV